MPNVYGRLPRTPDLRDFRAQPRETAYTGAFVNLEGGMPPVWDQGQLASCVSHGTCAAMVYALTHEGAAPIDPSRLFHYYAARLRAGYDVTQDTGMEIRDGLASAAKDGVPPQAEWPYVTDAFPVRPPDVAWADARLKEATVYGAVARGDIDAVIASGYPVVIGFDVPASFEDQSLAETGVMTVSASDEQSIGGHCVVLISTPKDGVAIPGGIKGTLYRRARNSWGSGWGDRGYFWYPLAAMGRASDFWQVTTVHAPAPPVPPPTPPPTPPPAPVPDAASAAFAVVLRAEDWVDHHHTGANARVSHAAKVWLEAKGL